MGGGCGGPAAVPPKQTSLQSHHHAGSAPGLQSRCARFPVSSLETLPTPTLSPQYWGRRPVAVTSRILQLLSISSGFLSRLAVDAARGNLAANEVQRAIDLRNIMTSLGPGECWPCLRAW